MREIVIKDVGGQILPAAFIYKKEVSFTDEIAFINGCGFFLAVFSRPASVCPCDSMAQGFFTV